MLSALQQNYHQMKRLIALLLCAGICYCAHAQNATIKGSIRDTTNKTNLVNTVITLIKSSDSSLYKFTRSKQDGSFNFSQLDSGQYGILITHRGYADYADHIALQTNSNLDLGKVMLTLKANLLQDVTVRSQLAAIRMKGDTTEYTADSFAVRPGASVEELLKKMPGITIDKDGKITAQGTNIEKILVDGEEFFGDDPTVATKNLQADAVDKVQVFDKKSDQAAFTGIDDGQSKKTINLKLKEDKKKGYFGKIDLGGGLNDRWNNSVMFNRFRAKKKFSVYGIASSTGKTGLNWDENSRYGGGNNVDYNEDFGYYMSYGNGDDLSYYGDGLPKSWAAGANYSNKYNNDKQNVNASYRFNKLNVEGVGNTITQSLTNDTSKNGTFYNTEARKTFNTRFRHSISGIYEYNIDSATSLKITLNGYKGQSSSYSQYINANMNGYGDTVLKSVRKNTSDGDNDNLKITALLRHKFKKAGRTISLNIDQQTNNSTSNGYLYALTSKPNGGVWKDSLTDQLKQNNQHISTLNTKLVYTEPLAQRVFWELSYAIRTNKNDAERLSYNKSAGGKYDDLADTLSNHYKFDVLTNTAGTAFRYNGKKLTASAGSDVAFQNFNQEDLFKDTTFTRHYTNFFPRANFQYKFSGSSSLRLNYNGSTTQPSINQIQPVADNTNPLVITVGNPLLKQAFRHSFDFGYNSYKVLSQRGIYLYGNFTTTSNAIVQSTNIDQNGKTIYQYINTNGNYNSYFGSGYGMKVKKFDFRFNVGLNFNTSQYTNLVNNVNNVTKNYAPGINYSFSKSKEKKFDIWYYGNTNYNYSTSSVNSSVKTNYWTQYHNLNINIQLPGKFELNNELEVNLRQKTVVFDNNNNVFLWNAYIGRKLLKDDKGMIKFSGYDILNQNKGYSRNISSSVMTQSNYQTLTRYFLLSFVWNFSRNPTGAN